MKHFIFDIDGTLLDTERPFLQSWEKTLSDLHYEASYEEVRFLSKLSIEEIGEKIRFSDYTALSSLWEKNYLLFQNNIFFYPGLEELLWELKNKTDVVLGIVTSRPRNSLSSLPNALKLKELFPIIICKEDTAKPKPDKEPLLKYMAVSTATAKDCFYFGDTLQDMDCALSAGMTACLCTWNGSALSHPNAHYHIQKVEDLANFFFI